MIKISAEFCLFCCDVLLCAALLSALWGGREGSGGGRAKGGGRRGEEGNRGNKGENGKWRKAMKSGWDEKGKEEGYGKKERVERGV